MNLFVNKYRKRILLKLAELEQNVAELKLTQGGVKQSLDPRTYCHYSVIIGELAKQITLLKSLL